MIELILDIPQDQQEIWIGKLYDLGVENFIEEESVLKCYMDLNLWENSLNPIISELCQDEGIQFKIIQVENQDWNKVWESNFEPILIENELYIHAAFHPELKEIRHSIIIAPKMAFGTGHHSTTSMILRWMSKHNFEKKKVLDFGCGTGILGIYAAIKGCIELDMIDNDPLSVENSLEHCSLNQINNANILLGSDNIIPDKKYDVIFANITRNVLEATLPTLITKLNNNGIIAMSGFLKDDETMMRNLVQDLNLTILSTLQDQDWIAMVVQS